MSTRVPPADIRPSTRPPWMEKDGPILMSIKVIVLVVVCLLVLYPFANIIGTSLASEAEIVRRNGLVILLPSEPTLAAYEAIFAGGVVTRAMMISIGVTVIGTAVNLVATTMLAYALSRPILGGRFILMTVLLTMLFGAGLIPNFLLVTALGLSNSYAALVLPGLISAFNFLVLRNFFQNIPDELVDAARVDGAGDVSIMLRVVLPLAKAPLAVVTLFYAVAHWNSFFNALLYLDSSKWPLALVLRSIVLQGQPIGGEITHTVGEAVPSIQGLQSAVVVVALVPILLVYPFLQRYFTQGVLTGAIKG